MKVLLVSISAPPQNTPESLQVMKYARHLAKHSELTILTINEEKAGWRRAEPGLQHVISPARFIRLPHYRLFSRIAVKIFGAHALKPDEDFLFPLQWKKAVYEMEEKPDVIYSRSTPYSSSLMGLKLQAYYGVPWVMHLSDPWADNPYLENRSQKQREKHQVLEKLCFERASAITLTSSKTVEHYQAKYPLMKNKFKLLYNVFDEDDANQEPVDFSKKCSFVFTGRLYGNRKVHPMMDAIEAAVARYSNLEQSTEFLFAGFFTDENIQRIRNSPCLNIKYLGPVTAKRALELQRQSTILLSIDAQDEGNDLYNLFFPSKLLDYLASRRKILCITGKNSSTFEIVNNQFGWCFCNENLNELPRFIDEIKSQFQARDKSFFLLQGDFSKFSAQRNVQRLVSVLKESIDEAY